MEQLPYNFATEDEGTFKVYRTSSHTMFNHHVNVVNLENYYINQNKVKVPRLENKKRCSFVRKSGSKIYNSCNWTFTPYVVKLDINDSKNASVPILKFEGCAPLLS